EYRQARADVSARRAEVERLQRTNRELERRLAHAETTEFVEREARKLGLVKPGERLFIVTGIEEWTKANRASARPRIR
ncbi:MAG TPA: septum formation initiator family protein, partial [Gaiellaceae bacterium]|nr:septum formation initiator family protein [Gaiellaceae bacterium]